MYKGGGHMRDSRETARWPFMYIVDCDGKTTGWLIIHAPVHSSYRNNSFARYRHLGYGFIGMCSFMDFPLSSAEDPLDYGSVCEGWCHCFRNPEIYLPEHSPRILLSFSDFTDPALVSRNSLGSLADVPAFDFIYIGANQPWKMRAKNWQLARECIRRLCGELRLRGLVIGIDPELAPGMPGLTVWPWLPREYFFQVLARARFLFVPNRLDASPRIMVEALCLDVPLLVNRHILGGWKYVSPASGVFFESEADILAAAQACLTRLVPATQLVHGQFQPGTRGAALHSLLLQIDPGFSAAAPLNVSHESIH